MAKEKQSGVVIDHETADKIALCSMKDQLRYLKNDVKVHLKKGEYMHPDDLVENQTKLIPALKTLIKYYGG